MHVIAGLAMNPPLYIRSVVRERETWNTTSISQKYAQLNPKPKPTLDEGNDEIEDLRVDEDEEDVGELEEVTGEEGGGEGLDQGRGYPRRLLLVWFSTFAICCNAFEVCKDY